LTGAHGRGLAQGNAAVLWWYLRTHAFLALAAAASGVLLFLRGRRTEVAAASAWLAVTVVTLALWRPLWENYLAWLLAPLAVAVGGGIREAVHALRSGDRDRVRTVLATMVLLASTGVGWHRAHTSPDWPPWTADRA